MVADATQIESPHNLKAIVQTIFQKIDMDQDGRLDYNEYKLALAQLDNCKKSAALQHLTDNINIGTA